MSLIRRINFLIGLLGTFCLLAFGTVDRTFDEERLEEYASNPQFSRYMELNVKPPSIWDQILWWLQRLWSEFWNDPLRSDLTWLLITLVLLGIGVFYFLKLKFSHVVTKSSSNGGSLFTLVEDDSIDYRQEIQKALESRNFRLAIRCLYLQTLINLSEKNLIRFQDWKSPLDYQFEIPEAGREPYRKLATLYEYSWYGDFEVNRSDFDKGTNFSEMLEEMEP